MERIVENLSKTWPIVISLLGFLLYVSSTRSNLQAYVLTNDKQVEMMTQQNVFVRELTVSNKKMIDILSEKTAIDHDTVIRIQAEVATLQNKVYGVGSSSESN